MKEFILYRDFRSEYNRPDDFTVIAATSLNDLMSKASDLIHSDVYVGILYEKDSTRKSDKFDGWNCSYFTEFLRVRPLDSMKWFNNCGCEFTQPVRLSKKRGIDSIIEFCA